MLKSKGAELDGGVRVKCSERNTQQGGGEKDHAVILVFQQKQRVKSEPLIANTFTMRLNVTWAGKVNRTGLFFAFKLSTISLKSSAACEERVASAAGSAISPCVSKACNLRLPFFFPGLNSAIETVWEPMLSVKILLGVDISTG